MVRVILPAFAWVLALSQAYAPAGPVSAWQLGNDYILENGRIRLVLRHGIHGYTEEVLAASRAGWKPVLGGTGGQGETLRLRSAFTSTRIVYHQVSIAPLPGGKALDLTAIVGPHRIHTRVELRPDRPLLHYRIQLDINGTLGLESLECEYRYLPGEAPPSLYPLDLGWCPGQRLSGDNVIADQAFHSPLALMLARGRLAAMIPDVTEIPPTRTPFKTAMRYHAGKNAASTGPWFSYGLMDYALNGHVTYRHDARMTYPVSNQSYRFGYVLGVQTEVDPPGALAFASRTLWDLFGAPRVQASSHPQYAPFVRCVRAAYDWAFRSPFRPVAWHEFTLGGRACGGTDMYVTFDRRRKGQVTNDPEFDGIWFQSWFNNLRSAFGMYLHGVRLGDPGLIQRAERIKNLALSAPVDRGLFPAVFDPGKMDLASGTWRCPPVVPDRKRLDDYYYHLPDAAWTGYWMLRWYQELHGDLRLALAAKALADRLVSLQLGSGAWPSWVARHTFKPASELRETAATAAVTLFLVRAHAVSGYRPYLDAARRGFDFLEREVLPESKWWDYECLVSCTGPHSDQRDPDTGLFDANTMSMIWAAEAFAEMFEVTRETRFLDRGRRVVNELSLYQHLHDKPWLFAIPSFGGFTAQNRDAEQNDARQALAAPVFLRYYRLTGREDLFYRGVAALRASFTNTYLPENKPVWAVMNLQFPWFGPNDHGFTEENTFHTGDPGAPFVMRASNFNWGPGSAAAAVAEVELRYGGLYVDLSRGRAFGLDGCLARMISSTPGDFTLTVTETLGAARTIRAVIEGVPPGKGVFIGSAAEPTPRFGAHQRSIPISSGFGSTSLTLPAHTTTTYFLTVR